MMISGTVIVMAITLVLWLMAEWKSRLLIRILAVILFFTASFFVLDFYVISPLRRNLAGSRFSQYDSARNMILLIDKGDIAKVTNALMSFLETKKELE